MIGSGETVHPSAGRDSSDSNLCHTVRLWRNIKFSNVIDQVVVRDSGLVCVVNIAIPSCHVLQLRGLQFFVLYRSSIVDHAKDLESLMDSARGKKEQSVTENIRRNYEFGEGGGDDDDDGTKDGQLSKWFGCWWRRAATSVNA